MADANARTMRILHLALTLGLTLAGAVHAPAASVYRIIADYRVHHPRIVPPQYFTRLEVIEGGIGAGTRTRVETRSMGKTQQFERALTAAPLPP